MARRDKVHDIVRNALEREGWTITNDPLVVKIGRKSGEWQPMKNYQMTFLILKILKIYAIALSFLNQ